MFRKLVSEVGVLFHSAATIRFDEKMTEVWKDLREEAKIFVSQAVKLNVIAVESVMNLARKMKKLEVNMLYSESFDYSDLKWFFVVAQSISLPGVGPRLNRLCQHRTQPGVMKRKTMYFSPRGSGRNSRLWRPKKRDDSDKGGIAKLVRANSL